MKKIPASEGIVKTLECLSGIISHDRSDVFRDKLGKVIVDTVKAFDTQEWETGICQNNDNNWVIVEQYPTRDEALNGHKKWVKKMKKNPKQKLKKIDVWS